MKENSAIQIDRRLERDDLIVIAGAGGFIAGALARHFHDLGYTRSAPSTASRCRSGISACPASRAAPSRRTSSLVPIRR